MKMLTVVGARPQFIKAATVSRVVGECSGLTEVLVHTGQHFDHNMSRVFFDELHLPRPDYNLGVGGGLHGEMTGRMLTELERVFLDEKPAVVLIYGDTNSTLAGALAAAKLQIPVAHVEAGLRSFNRRMPEEINRVIADHMSSLLFCPTTTAVANLEQEGVRDGVHQVGDVMYDAALFYKELAKERSGILASLGVNEGEFVLATCHRAENTDDKGRLRGILEALASLARETRVVFPVHPRTRKAVEQYGLNGLLDEVTAIDPVSYLDVIELESHAQAVITDSGGMQKEAFFFGKPCLTMREETEWVETVDAGWNQLVAPNAAAIREAFAGIVVPDARPQLYGDGHAAEKILKNMEYTEG